MDYYRDILSRLIDIYERRKIFFDIVDKCHLKEKFRDVRIVSKAMFAVKASVVTRMYLPLDILIRVWGKIKGWEKDYK